MNSYSSIELSDSYYSEESCFSSDQFCTPRKSRPMARIYNLLNPADPYMTFIDTTLGDERDVVFSLEEDVRHMESPLQTPVKRTVASTVATMLGLTPEPSLPASRRSLSDSGSSGYRSRSSRQASFDSRDSSLESSPTRPCTMRPRPQTLGGDSMVSRPKATARHLKPVATDKTTPCPLVTTTAAISPSKRRQLAKKIQRFSKKLKKLSPSEGNIHTLAFL